MNDVTAGSRVPPQPGQDREEPEEATEDDIPAQDHTPEGTQPGEPPRGFDGDEVERHAE